jgi:hypothetical protein
MLLYHGVEKVPLTASIAMNKACAPKETHLHLLRFPSVKVSVILATRLLPRLYPNDAIYLNRQSLDPEHPLPLQSLQSGSHN